MKETRSYIGITGFMSQDEVRAMLDLMPPNSKKLLMVGALASTTTLNDERPSKFFGRYPVVEDIQNIFVKHPLALNFIHFNDKTKRDGHILGQLLNLTETVGDKLDGFQLNIKWPAPGIIMAYKDEYPDKKFVLQIGSDAFKAVERSPEKMAQRVKEYKGLADYVLVDPSGGTGTEFNIKMTEECLDALTALNMNIKLGAAGGLYAGNLSKLILPLIQRGYSDICIDTEGKMRNKKDDSLNLIESSMYVITANRIFKNN